MNANSQSQVSRLVGACLSLLVAAAAVFIAVRLIEAVWLALVVIVCVGGFIAAALLLLRNQRGGW